jgi:hypothetical protein
MLFQAGHKVPYYVIYILKKSKIQSSLDAYAERIKRYGRGKYPVRLELV